MGDGNNHLDLSEVINVAKIQLIMDDFYATTNIGVAILDNRGEVLIATGWQDICTKFHRINPQTKVNCIESDLELSDGVVPGNFKIYKCKNGMWDMSTPIIIENQKLGNLFLGQFFFDDEKIDYDFFRNQAAKYGFDEQSYIEALDRVPKWSREKVNNVMSFYSKFIELISNLSLKKNEIERAYKERLILQEKIEQEEVKLRNLANSVQDVFFSFDKKLNYTFVNKRCEEITGIPASEIIGKNFFEVEINRNFEWLYGVYKSSLDLGISKNLEVDFSRDNRQLILDVNIYPYDEGLSVYARDITEKRNYLLALQESEFKLSSIINNAEDIIFIKDVDLNYIVVNDAMCRIFGKKREELTGCKDIDLFSANIAQIIKEADIQVLKGENIRTESEKKVGEKKIFFDTIKFPLRNTKDEIIGICGIARDITEKKKIGNDLKESEMRLNLALEGAKVGIWDQDFKTGKIIRNKNWADMLGYDLKEVEETLDFWLNRIHPDDISNNEDSKRMHEEGIIPSFKLEQRMRCKDGSYKWILNWGKIIERDKNGKPLRATGVHIDIDDKIKAELALRENEQKLISLINSTPDIICFKDSEGRWLQENNSIIKLYKLKGIEYKNKTEFELAEYTADIDKEAFKNCFKSDEIVWQKGTPSRGDEIIPDVKGGFHIFDVIKVPLFYDDGKRKGLVVFGRDITDIKNAEDALTKSEKKYRNLYNTINQGVIYQDRNGNISSYNPAALKILGLTETEIKKRTSLTPEWRSIREDGTKFPGEEHPTMIALKTGAVVKDVVMGIFNPLLNDYKWLRIDAFPQFKNGESEPYQTFAVFSDITEIKKQEEELLKAKIQAEDMSRLKSSFFANMSHELRTPLNGILGFSELMEDETDVEEMRKMSSIINRSGKRLLETLNLILDLSRLEAGLQDVNLIKTDIYKLIDETIELYTAEIKKKNLRLEFIKEKEEEYILTDPKIIGNTLNNLINNAIKYTHKGEITISIGQSVIDNKDMIKINVRDTGIGIEEKNIEKIFDEFRQISQGYGRSYEGTGLGLSICRKYMNLLSGRISVKSKPGKGSDFQIEFPKIETNIDIDNIGKKIRKGKDILTNKKSFKKRRVLYIEDDEDSIILVKRILKDFCDIDVLRNPEEVINIVNKIDYELILIDINLGSGMNGIDIAGELKNIDKYKKVNFIAVTAYAMKGDKENFLEGNFSHYISKPFRKQDLLEIVLKAKDNKSS